MNGKQAGKFFVTGLPRSRTAWMAAFLSTGETLCLHEPEYRLQAIEELPALLDSTFYRHFGVSSSGLGFFTKWIIDNMQARVLVIDRDIGEVEDSLKKLGIPIDRFLYCRLLQERLQEIRDHPMVKWISFPSLQHRRVMQEIYWWLMPGCAFDEDRWQQFNGFNIEVDLLKTVQLVQKSQGNFDSLFKDVHASLREMAKQSA
jgi:hypothetical protein